MGDMRLEVPIYNPAAKECTMKSRGGTQSLNINRL